MKLWDRLKQAVARRKEKPLADRVLALLLGALFVFAVVITAGEWANIKGLPSWSRIYTALGGHLSTTDTLFDAQAKIHFIDVGQGDSVLLEQNGHFALIDAGEAAAGKTICAYLEKCGVKKLDYLLLTHLHADHIGGASFVMREYTPGLVILPDIDNTAGALPQSLAYQNLLYAIEENTPAIVQARPGDCYTLGQGELQIVYTGIPSDNLNNTSTAVVFRYKELSYFAAGDGEAPYEKGLLNDGKLPAVQVMKVSHHGSASSTCEALLNALRPGYAVVSCGAGNDYGCPAPEVLSRLAAAGASVYRTDENGTVVIGLTEDGLRVQVELLNETM